jgi:ribosomal protein S18 acetylase RimI-like enzyme
VNKLLVNLKNRLNESKVQELIEYSVFPDPDKIKETINNYKNQEDLELMGFEFEGNMIGIIGYSIDNNNILQIKHISVDPVERGKGYGRFLIIEMINTRDPLEVHAETDLDAVDFYRSIGFVITSLGEKYPGAERFKCIYKTKMLD